MKLKLLNRQEISAHKALERSREVSEGKKLAERVDRLREVRAEEEASLEKFRQKTIEEIERQIKEKTDELDSIKGEKFVVAKELELLQVPRDKEWAKVIASKEEVQRFMGVLLGREGTIEETEKTLATRQKSLTDEEGRIANLKHLTSQALVDAENTLLGAKKESEEKHHKANALLALAEATNQEAAERETVVAGRERDATIKEQATAEKEADLVKRERLLRDRYATLERTIKRMNIKL